MAVAARARSARSSPRRGRGLPLLRPHLHDGLVPAPDRAAADRLQGPAAAGEGRAPRRRPRPPRRPQGRPGRRGRRAPHRRRGHPAARRLAHAGVQGGRASVRLTTHIDGAWYRCCGGHVRKLVDCCSHQQAAASTATARCGLLLQGPPRVLRHVLPDEGPVLTAGCWPPPRSPPGSPAHGRRAASRWSRRSRRRATPAACGRRWSRASRSRSARSPAGC